MRASPPLVLLLLLAAPVISQPQGPPAARVVVDVVREEIIEQWRPVTAVTVPAGSNFEVLRPGRRKIIHLPLAAGQYKATLQRDALDESLEASFTVAALEGDVAGRAAEEPIEDVEDEGGGEVEFRGEEVRPASGDVHPEVKLRGIITSEDSRPRFSLTVYLPDGTSVDTKVHVGERVFDTWELSEYNPEHQTITLSDSNGSNLLTIKVQQGEIRIQAVAKTIVESSLIDLTDGAPHPVVFGDLLLQYLNQLVALFNAHLHVGELAAGFIPVTPAPPATPYPPADPSLISTRVKTG